MISIKIDLNSYIQKFNQSFQDLVINKFKARLYKYILVLSYNFDLSILDNFIKKKIIFKKLNYPTVWLLNYERSLAEKEFFQKKNYNILLIENLFLKELILFFGEDIYKKVKNKKCNGKVKFLRSILNKYNLRLIISPALHYKINLVGYLFRKKDIKFLIYHRECYNFSKNHIKGFKTFLKDNNFYWKLVDCFIFHNEFYKKLFSNNSKILKNKTKVIGPLRFSKLKFLKKNNNYNQKRKITFFAFTPSYAAWVHSNKYNKFVKNPNPFGNISYYLKTKLLENKYEREIYFYDAFIQSNIIFAENALMFPEYEFEIKLKWKDERWIGLIYKIIKIKLGKYPKNLVISYDSNVWSKIQNSFLICGYGSTTLLEAGYLKTPSAQFICGELLNKKYKNRNRIISHYKSFKLIKNSRDLTNLIENKSNLFSKKLYKMQKNNFFSYVANIEKDNLEKKFEKLVKNLI